MPSLSDHQSTTLVKLLTVGDAMTGKTGSLVSLVAAGYKLRILDFDSKLDILRQAVLRECPDMIGNINYVTLRDKRKTIETGSVIDGKVKAFVTGMKMLDHWKEPDGTDLGKPSEWGPECILVLDSLSRFCDAAYDFRESLMPANLAKEPRAIYGDAQDAVETALATLTGPSFSTNVIVIAHVRYIELPDGTTKGFPQGVGAALSPKIPQYFSSYVRYTNKSGKRQIETTSSPLIDLANPAPFLVDKTYPIETGLASIFEVLCPPPAKEKPKAVTLQRRA